MTGAKLDPRSHQGGYSRDDADGTLRRVAVGQLLVRPPASEAVGRRPRTRGSPGRSYFAAATAAYSIAAPHPALVSARPLRPPRRRPAASPSIALHRVIITRTTLLTWLVEHRVGGWVFRSGSHTRSISARPGRWHWTTDIFRGQTRARRTSFISFIGPGSSSIIRRIRTARSSFLWPPRVPSRYWALGALVVVARR